METWRHTDDGDLQGALRRGHGSCLDCWICRMGPDLYGDLLNYVGRNYIVENEGGVRALFTASCSEIASGC